MPKKNYTWAYHIQTVENQKGKKKNPERTLRDLKGAKIRITFDFFSETMQARGE